MSHSLRILLIAISLLFALALASLALAQTVSAESSGSRATTTSNNATTTWHESDDDGDEREGTTTRQKDEDERASTTGQNDEDDEGDDEDEDNEGEEHRSEVAKQVRALLMAADRDGGIGEEVREIAHEYASSSEHISDALQKLERRPTWIIFLIGTDYKNLGELRSELSTTHNRIDRLTRARDRATDSIARAALDTEIQAIMAMASSTEAFVEQNEGKFSVFGWFVRLFND